MLDPFLVAFKHLYLQGSFALLIFSFPSAPKRGLCKGQLMAMGHVAASNNPGGLVKIQWFWKLIWGGSSNGRYPNSWMVLVQNPSINR